MRCSPRSSSWTTCCLPTAALLHGHRRPGGHARGRAPRRRRLRLRPADAPGAHRHGVLGRRASQPAQRAFRRRPAAARRGLRLLRLPHVHPGLRAPPRAAEGDAGGAALESTQSQGSDKIDRRRPRGHSRRAFRRFCQSRRGTVFRRRLSRMGGGAAIIIWILVFFGIFYFLAIRPQRRQRQAHSQMVTMLKKGDEVVTIGGLFGTVTKIGDDWVELEIAKRTKARCLKRAISSITSIVEDEDEYIEAGDDDVIDETYAAPVEEADEVADAEPAANPEAPEPPQEPKA